MDQVEDRLPCVRYIVLLITMQFDNFPNLSTPGDRIIHQLIIISSKTNIMPDIVFVLFVKYFTDMVVLLTFYVNHNIHFKRPRL